MRKFGNLSKTNFNIEKKIGLEYLITLLLVPFEACQKTRLILQNIILKGSCILLGRSGFKLHNVV